MTIKPPMTQKKTTASRPTPAVVSKPKDISSLRPGNNSTTSAPAKPPPRIDIDELLNRIDLAALVERAGTTLEYQSGKDEYRGKCPLHSGSNPTAFHIFQDDDNRWRWKCWSCGKGGDALAFVQEDQNISDFLETVRYLAEWGNIPFEDIGLTPESQKKVQERKARTDIFDLAARFAAEQLWSDAGAEALAYARVRGFTDDIIRLAGFGFLDGSTALRDHLEQSDADMALVRKFGIVRKDGCDFTANAKGNEIAPTGWLIYTHRRYPNARRKKCEQCEAETWHIGKDCLRHEHAITHLRKVDYLSARALAPVDPKNKSRNLPGSRQLYKAEVPGTREIILCEGPADAESYRLLGFTSWALCGLGHIPEDDLRQLKQRPVVYLALDNDEAGLNNQARLAQELGPLAMLVPALDILDDNENIIKDANAWLQAGATSEDVTAQLKLAIPWIDKQLDRVQKAQPHELQTATAEIVDLLEALPKELAPRYMAKAQRRLGMNRKELRQLMNEYDTVTEDGKIPTLAKIIDGVLRFLGEPLGNFSVWIVKELILDDGLNPPEVRYTLHGKLATGEPLIPVEIEAEEFAGLNWIGKRWGARPILYLPGSKRHLFIRAVQEVSLADMERERVFTHTGWSNIDGKRSFLTGSGRITADGFDDDIRVDLDQNLRHYELPEPPIGKERFNAIRASLGFLDLGPLSVTAPLWAAIYASLLTEVMPLYTMLWVYGSTQSGKSVITHLALTHFGKGFIDGRKYHAPTDWMSTLTHLEESMFTAKDVPLVIDDFAPQFHSVIESRKMSTVAHKTIRSVGNRSARGRSKKYQKRTEYPRGMVISTAELLLPGQSDVGRMLNVSIASGDILPDHGEGPRAALNKAQEMAQAGAYSLAMAAYIQWLAANWDRAIKKLHDIYQESLRLMIAQDDVHNRLPDYFATLDAAQQLAVGAFHEMGVISSDEAAEIMYNVSNALRDVVVRQDETIAAESPVRKLFEALNSMLERRKVYLAPRTNSYVYTPPPQADLIGWADPGDDAIYLDDGACLENARSYWAALGENFDTTTEALRRQVSQIPGLLAERSKGRHIQVSKWLAGKTRRALSVDKQTVTRLYGIVLQNEPDILVDEPESGDA